MRGPARLGEGDGAENSAGGRQTTGCSAGLARPPGCMETGLDICDVYGASSSGSKSIITSSSSGPPPHSEPRALVMPVVALLSELARESADAPEYIEREEREE